MRWRIFLISIGTGVLPMPLAAQLSLPQVQLPRTDTVLDPVADEALGSIESLGETALRTAQRLVDLRERRLNRLVRLNRKHLELDVQGAPARRGELLITEPDLAQLETARALGFSLIGRETVEGLELNVARLAVPPDLSLAEAERALQASLPDAAISADNLHFQSGSAPMLPLMVRSSSSIGTGIGVIDGAPASAIKVTRTRGFAEGAPFPSNHGSAIASLLRFAGARDISIADVYGTDPAGGNALAIARALGWLTGSGNKVINISLVGPENALVAKAISAAQKRGVVIVAAVGNDGPASPPSYPASYKGVVAVTAVDKRNRALIEAGKALHLDYAAPGADIFAPDRRGKPARLRGTSYASPLVATRIAAAIDRGGNWRSRLDSEARDLGKKGPDPTFGRGLVCEACRPAKQDF